MNMSPADAELIASRPDCPTSSSPGRLRVPFGMTPADRVMHAPEDVPSGAACVCVCPGCGAPLIARHARTSNRVSNFAHAAGSECATGFETTVHLAAKQLLLQERKVFLPALSATAELADSPLLVWRKHLPIAVAGVHELEDVQLEVWCDGVRPDVLATPAGGQPIAIEIAVTSFVGPEKLERLRAQRRPAVEFDLRHLRNFTWDALREALIGGTASATWCYHPTRELLEASLLASLRAQVDASEQAAREQEQARRGMPGSHAGGGVDQERQRAALVEATERQRRQRAEEFAPSFRARSEAEKEARVCDGFELRCLPRVLRAEVPGEMLFGVTDPLLWQAALFGGLVHHAARRNEAQFNGGTVFRWVNARFVIASAHLHEAQVSVLAYLRALADRDVLQVLRANWFRVRVESLSAFETLCAYRERQVNEQVGLAWAQDDEWPTLTAAREIAVAHCGQPELPPLWVAASMLPRLVSDEPIAKVLSRMCKPPRLPDYALMTYWIAAGFVVRT